MDLWLIFDSKAEFLFFLAPFLFCDLFKPSHFVAHHVVSLTLRLVIHFLNRAFLSQDMSFVKGLFIFEFHKEEE